MKVVRASGTIVSIEVSLGYDASRPAIKESLIAAADSIGLEQPFVQLRDLGDFSVTYRIAGLLASKRALADSVLAGGETAFTELTDSELADLVELRGGER